MARLASSPPAACLISSCSGNCWMLQVTDADGALAFSAVVNIPHSDRHVVIPYVKLHTSSAAVSRSRNV